MPFMKAVSIPLAVVVLACACLPSSRAQAAAPGSSAVAAAPAADSATPPAAGGSPGAAPAAAASPAAAAGPTPAAGAQGAAAAAGPSPAGAGPAAPGGDAGVQPPADAAAPADAKTLDQEVQGLKKDVIELNKDLFVLEEELLFPANTQVAVFLSMDVGTFFALDSVTIKIDNKEVANYLYTAREADALLKGGVHRIYLGNQKVGKHELVAFFTGKGPVERDYRRGASITFDKGVGAKYLELKITDRVSKHQPEFTVKDWD
jgi:hypothetical protein